MKTSVDTKDFKTYPGDYSDGGLLSKFRSCAAKAGRKVVRTALILFYELMDPNISLKDKAVIIGALGYFIAPLDIIPDAIPGVGFSDDLSALLAAYEFVKSHISPEIGRKADNKLDEWFGRAE